MADRLSALDVSFLHVESPTAPMHVGSLAIFDPPSGGFAYADLIALVERRLIEVPRYRQIVRWIPGRLAFPIWTDDSQFDIAFHVRRSALPRPGTRDQLSELVARLQARPLDRSRPLWEFYLVEGLADGRLALISKTHTALVDGIDGVDIAQVILSDAPVSVGGEEIPLWMPAPGPSASALVTEAAIEMLRRPSAVGDAVRLGITDARAVTRQVTGLAGGVFGAMRAAARPAPTSPLNVPTTAHRRFAAVRLPLDEVRSIPRRRGGTVNDAVLTVVAGALRGWLLARGEPVTSGSSVRAMVPVGVREPDAPLGTPPKVTPFFVDLPVGEPSPLVRLSHINYAMAGVRSSGRTIPAQGLLALSGFAPPTLHALASRAAARTTRRLFNVLIANVPGPQRAMYAGNARLAEMYPIIPLAKDQALSIGLTSYAGNIYVGLNGDRDGMSDLDLIAELLTESLTELRDAAARSSKATRTGGAK